METSVKNYNLEFLRLIATIGVVFDHIGVCWIHYWQGSATQLDNIVYYSLVASCHWPVPVFMAITGALMLRKDSLDYKQVWKYFKRIALLVFLFGTVFAWMELYFNTHAFNGNMVLQGFLNMLSGNSWKHLWYLYMLLGIYLVLPIIIVAKQKITPPILLIFLAIMTLFSSILPTVGIEKTFVKFPLDSVYLIYLIMGYILSLPDAQRSTENRVSDNKVALMCALSFILLIALVILDYTIGTKISASWFNYVSPVIIMQSLSIFYLCVKRGGKFDRLCNTWIVQRLNRCSLGIYIVHMVWINVVIKMLHINLMDYGYWAIPIAGVVIFTLSWLSTEVMIRIQLLKKML